MATVVLVLITGLYVLVTYLLVREQRMQADHPAVDFQLGDFDSPDVKIVLRNVGTGAAAELTIRGGPGEGVPVQTSPPLGRRSTLLAGDSCVWKLRPPNGSNNFTTGQLPLTMQYFDNPRSKVFYEVVLLEFVKADEGWRLRNVGSVQVISDRKQIRRNARRSLPISRRFGFFWQTRRQELSELLLDEHVCVYVRDSLIKAMSELKELRSRMEAVRSAI